MNHNVEIIYPVKNGLPAIIIMDGVTYSSITVFMNRFSISRSAFLSNARRLGSVSDSIIYCINKKEELSKKNKEKEYHKKHKFDFVYHNTIYPNGYIKAVEKILEEKGLPSKSSIAKYISNYAKSHSISKQDSIDLYLRRRGF